MKKTFILTILFQILFICSCSNSANTDYVQTEANQEDEVKVHFINLENGTCTFLELPGGESMLIDCGSEADFPTVYRYIKEAEFTIIDYFIATSSDRSHIGGAEKLMQTLQVNDMFISNHAVNSSVYKQTVSAAAGSRCNVRVVSGGSSILDDDRISISIAGPVNDYSDARECALSVVVSYGDRTFFFEGDCGERAEADMLASMKNYLKCDVLRVANCGSTQTTSPAFAQSLCPEFAVIPVFANYDKAQCDKTYETLDKLGAEVLKSDSDGTIVFKTNGANLIVNTEK